MKVDIFDVGQGRASGDALHAQLLRDAYPELTQIGLDVQIVAQDATAGSQPDAVIDPTPLLDIPDDADAVDTRDALANFAEQHPLAYQLTGGREAYIEAEKSTGTSKKGQTILNLADAINQEKKCVFLCRREVAADIWDTLATDPSFARSDYPVDGETRLYHSSRTLRVDGQTAYREGSRESVWVREDDTGAYVLRDDDGTEHARFDDPLDIFLNTTKYAAVGDAADDDLRTIRKPVIPELEFDFAPRPGADWHVVIVPEDGGPLELYHDGLTVPLSAVGQAKSHMSAESPGHSEPDAAAGDGLRNDLKHLLRGKNR
ncbi:hypothetical protein [Halegenticoccus soli]|uniref:hypothetical protein n=1 Tax=Halegenticoccus soli TaxID=1985678 RepID=UPI00117AB0BC|nr:hypothetical protein [Halegenticoccus soli]